MRNKGRAGQRLQRLAVDQLGVGTGMRIDEKHLVVIRQGFGKLWRQLLEEKRIERLAELVETVGALVERCATQTLAQPVDDCQTDAIISPAGVAVTNHKGTHDWAF